MRYSWLVVSIEGICSVSLPKRAIFTLLIFIGCVLVTGGVIALTRPIVLKIGFSARVIAALSPIVCGGWFATKTLRVTRDRDLSFGEVVKLVFWG